MSESAKIVNAITGETVSTNIKFFVGLEDFKDFICHRWYIPRDQLLILLPFGHKLKISTFKECLRSSGFERYEFYVYDRRLFSAVNEPVEEPSIDDHRSKIRNLLSLYVKDSMIGGESTLLRPITSPLVNDNLNSQKLSYRTITSLLTTNLGWLSALEIDVHYFRSLIQGCISQINEILQCLSVCDQYLRLYCYDVENLYNSNVEFLDQLLQNGLTSKWKQCYNNVLSQLNGLDGPLQQYVDKKLLERNEETLTSLDHQVNSKLKVIKGKLNDNATLREFIGSEVSKIRTDFTPNKAEDKLENAMQEKFDELVEETRSKSREFLDKDSSDLTDSGMEEIRNFLVNIKSEVAAKLFTIAQSLFTQTEKFQDFKFRLQEKVVMAFGQIAFVQVETLALKKSLLEDCNKDLELYQKFELEFAQIEDLPMIYGLYLIEKYRRESWLLQVMSHGVLLSADIRKIMDTEMSCRNRWSKNFGDIASIFRNNVDSFSDIEGFDERFNGGVRNMGIMCEEQIKKCKQSLEMTFKIIEKYMKTLSALEVPKDALDVLMQNLAEAKGFQIVTNQSFLRQESAAPSLTQLNGYKARIKKLESLLYEAKISDPGHWPSGILHTSHFKPFHNNVSTVSSKITLNSSGLLEPNRNVNVVKVLEMEKEMKNLRTQVEELQIDSNIKKDQISAANTKVSDLELERSAFKETMLNLNRELSRLTEQEQLQKKDLVQKQSMYQNQLCHIINENKTLLQEIETLEEKHRNLQHVQEQKEQHIAKTKEDFDAEKLTWQNGLHKLENENGELKDQVSSLKQELAHLHELQEERRTEESSPQILDDNEIVTLKAFNESMEAKMFEIFSSDVFILENIGLLLFSDDDNHVQIKRVKGLRKGMNQSILDDSIQVTQLDVSVKSPVYHSIKSAHDEIQTQQEIEKHKFLLEGMNKLYDDKLYETAIIKRFRDIESLAKKLTKENKKKKDTLERLQNEKITLKNLQVGDLALFLPTRKNNSTMDSSTSSLNSSFSSVDLSTPPPFDAAPIHSMNKEKAKKSKKHPWAAFTALDNNTRYFLKDENDITKGKDWFVGRITNLEQFIADSPANNPYKLEKNAVWFQVSATVISCQV
ncbi:hypothetical protein ZYGR_0I06610 [Zygosaccharomyces rouxii]|uniref:Autophagy-related protein 11 n=2 Tax=Zygosaccharomyces rouxii TaxID=4956 RepID=C5DUC6_ZYGRC|nr:uncharacterized protein ZYRO0C15686g [Zygosaccharomyces rouxii]KAH9201440.1 autophagy-related protein 11-domain-containing protein [Zygosaccharomyces rouxii]GAV48364.1 hypothetical protein ZYGR_0I06610 [Zygosaccharomyces rouxii]CAR27387.1 ZYRO0C15686p [Zygosaccharomyces rouxii]